MKTSEILFRAREIQLERGRAYGWSEDAQGRVCMLRAIDLAADYHGYGAARDYLQECIGEQSIARFSDGVCETKEDMAAAFEIAACCASAEGK